jgi:hypothetical protein|tara:strand:+ start:3334 stop:3570 length:237 start_codon:yes stop_codon:yes gene_type:complete
MEVKMVKKKKAEKVVEKKKAEKVVEIRLNADDVRFDTEVVEEAVEEAVEVAPVVPKEPLTEAQIKEKLMKENPSLRIT